MEAPTQTPTKPKQQQRRAKPISDELTKVQSDVGGLQQAMKEIQSESIEQKEQLERMERLLKDSLSEMSNVVSEQQARYKEATDTIGEYNREQVAAETAAAESKTLREARYTLRDRMKDTLRVSIGLRPKGKREYTQMGLFSTLGYVTGVNYPTGVVRFR